jgi:hypothetical protein
MKTIAALPDPRYEKLLNGMSSTALSPSSESTPGDAGSSDSDDDTRRIRSLPPHAKPRGARHFEHMQRAGIISAVSVTIKPLHIIRSFPANGAAARCGMLVVWLPGQAKLELKLAPPAPSACEKFVEWSTRYEPDSSWAAPALADFHQPSCVTTTADGHLGPKGAPVVAKIPIPSVFNIATGEIFGDQCQWTAKFQLHDEADGAKSFKLIASGHVKLRMDFPAAVTAAPAAAAAAVDPLPSSGLVPVLLFTPPRAVPKTVIAAHGSLPSPDFTGPPWAAPLIAHDSMVGSAFACPVHLLIHLDVTVEQASRSSSALPPLLPVAEGPTTPPNPRSAVGGTGMFASLFTPV